MAWVYEDQVPGVRLARTLYLEWTPNPRGFALIAVTILFAGNRECTGGFSFIITITPLG